MSLHTDTTLDSGCGISGIEAEDQGSWFCLSVILMAGSANIPSKDNFDAVIGYVREFRAGLEKAVSALEHQPADAALGYVNGMKAGLDTALITLEHLARLAEDAAKLRNQGADAVAGIHPAHRRVGVRLCPTCRLLISPKAPHECYVNSPNEFTPENLDALLEDEWYIEEAPHQEDAPRGDEHSSTSHNPDLIPKPDAMPVDPAPIPVAETVPKLIGMRDGSKKHRVYEATRKLLELNGPMHIDNMLESVSALGLFEGVKDQRTRFANLLSQFKGKRLMDSDNRGNWSLPNGKATD